MVAEQASSLGELIARALPQGRALVAAKHGLFLVHTTDEWVGRLLTLTGQYCEQELAMLSCLDIRNSKVIEIGAYIGALSVPLAKYLDGNNSELICYEPQLQIAQILIANFALNALNNFEVRALAVGDRGGVAYTKKQKYEELGSFHRAIFSDIHTILDDALLAAPMVCLDEDFYGVEECISLIKIDADGMELQILQGASVLIRSAEPYLYFRNVSPENWSAVLRHVSNLGYQLFLDLPYIASQKNYFEYKISAEAERMVAVNVLAIPVRRQAPNCELMPIVDFSRYPLGA